MPIATWVKPASVLKTNWSLCMALAPQWTLLDIQPG